MMRKIWIHIQRQPRELREHYAFVGAIVATGFIALVWAGYVATFPHATSYTAALSNGQAATAVEESAPRTAPLSGFWGQMKEQFSDLQDTNEKIQSALPANVSE